MVKVIFTYDEQHRKWEATIQGVTSPVEARQAFNAVVVTCRQTSVTLDHKVEEIDGGYKIIPVIL